MQYIQFLTPQPDDLAALLEALAAVFEVDADLWLDETAALPHSRPGAVAAATWISCELCGTVQGARHPLFMQLRKLRAIVTILPFICVPFRHTSALWHEGDQASQ